VLSVMAHGFCYDDAWHMGFPEYRRFTSLAAAWAIPSDQREGAVRWATAEDADRYL